MARISIFKGREARLNKAIFWILAQQEPLTTYDIWRKLRTQRDFAYIRYHIVNRRVRALDNRGYIEKSGEKKTKTGFKTKIYKLTVRAYLAILLSRITLDDFTEKAPENMVITTLSAIIFTQF
jgi:DNA-binding PadR family transcriptional regulator